MRGSQGQLVVISQGTSDNNGDFNGNGNGGGQNGGNNCGCKESGSMLMRKMRDAMLVTPADVTGIVDRLEDKKLVRRTSGEGDRRATIIEITAEGKALYDKAAKKKDYMIPKALAKFTKDELLTLSRLLEKF